MRVRQNRDYEVIPLEEVIWDQENHVIEIYPLEPVAAGNDIEIVFSNVRNPRFGGMYYFNARVFSPGIFPWLAIWELGF